MVEDPDAISPAGGGLTKGTSDGYIAPVGKRRGRWKIWAVLLLVGLAVYRFAFGKSTADMLRDREETAARQKHPPGFIETSASAAPVVPASSVGPVNPKGSVNNATVAPLEPRLLYCSTSRAVVQVGEAAVNVSAGDSLLVSGAMLNVGLLSPLGADITYGGRSFRLAVQQPVERVLGGLGTGQQSGSALRTDRPGVGGR